MIAFALNGKNVSLDLPPLRRLADVLREELGLTATKIGCNAGDCGACVVFSTHHHEVVETFAGRALTLSQGRIIDDRLL